MGKQIVTKLTDDLTGEELEENEAIEVTLTMLVKRPGEDTEPAVRYELMFGAASLDTFNTDLAKYTTDAIPETVTPKRPRDRVDPENARMREWWRGLTVGQIRDMHLPDPTDRGRVPDAVKEAYAAAHANA
jgi:hypothetical protein